MAPRPTIPGVVDLGGDWVRKITKQTYASRQKESGMREMPGCVLHYNT